MERNLLSKIQPSTILLIALLPIKSSVGKRAFLKIVRQLEG